MPAMTALLVLLGLAALLSGVALGRAIWGGYPAKTPGVPLLTAKEQAIVAAAADALFPEGGAIPASGTEAGIVAYVARAIARVPRETRILLRLLLAFVEHGPWLFGPRRVRLTRMLPAERALALGRMATSPVYFLRVAFASLRTLLAMGYMAHGPVACAVGCAPAALGALAGRSSPGLLGPENSVASVASVASGAADVTRGELLESGERPVARPGAAMPASVSEVA